MAILDLRRTDQRTNVRINPFWMTSAEIGIAADDAEAILFSFPEASGSYIIQNMMLECTTDFTAGTIALTIGIGTILTNDVTTGGTITETDEDEFFASFDPTLGKHFPISALAEAAPNTYTGSDFAIARAQHGGYPVVGVDDDVKCIYASLTSTGVLTAGAAKLHVLLSKLQG